MIADQRLPKRNTAFRGVTDGCRYAGIRHRHHYIGVNMRFLRQQPSHIFPRFLYWAAKNQRIRPGKVNVLENALGQWLFRSVALPRDAFRTNAHHFSRLHVVQVLGADQIECASL